MVSGEFASWKSPGPDAPHGADRQRLGGEMTVGRTLVDTDNLVSSPFSNPGRSGLLTGIWPGERGSLIR